MSGFLKSTRRPDPQSAPKAERPRLGEGRAPATTALTQLRPLADGSAAVQRMQALQRLADSRSGPAQRQVEEDELLQGKMVQRVEEEEALQGRMIQRAEDEEPLQGRMVQRAEDGEPLQGKMVQRMEEEEPLQGRMIQRAEDEEALQGKAIQRMEEDEPLQGDTLQRQPAAPAKGGLPADLRQGVENLSGISMADVRVHQNSGKPAQVGAHAYAQGRDIHLGPGQEKHLPHEAWHIVQQAQGRVRPTMQAKGVAINDDPGLEAEADRMGAAAAAHVGQSDLPTTDLETASNSAAQPAIVRKSWNSPTIQRRLGVEAELSVPVTLAPVGAANADDRIRAFLGGGVWYDTALSPMVGNYSKKADHGPIGTVIENARQQMDVAVQGHGYAPIPQLNGGTKPAIMEYATAPFQVHTNAQRTALRNCITAMAVDIAAVHAAAAGGVTPIAHGGGNFLVGVPPVADFTAFEAANGLAGGTGAAIHANIVNNINDQLYVQMTMGVQLRRMQEFQKKLRRNRHLASQAGLGDPNHAILIRLVTDYAAADAGRVVSNLALLPADVRRSKSLKGYTTLLFAYIFGSYVYRQVDIAKNMVAALSKTPLHVVQQELDVAKRPDQWAAPTRAAFQAAIIARAINRLQTPVFQTYWPAGNHNAGLLGNWQANWLPNVLSGASDSFAGDAANPGQLVMGPNPADDHTIAPENDQNSKAITGGPGRPAGRAAPHAAEVSGVIPMELRFIEERPQPGQLLALVNRGISLIRNSAVR